jgi:hypothetical protein
MEDSASNHWFSIALSGSDEASPSAASREPDISKGQKARAPRFTLFIRAAKLVAHSGEFVCVVRDVSETGVRLRLFHTPPTGESIELHMPGGSIHQLRQVRRDGYEVGYEFLTPIDLSSFLSAKDPYPKRGLRLNLRFPVSVGSLSGLSDGTVVNLSQQGACFSCEGLYAINQALRVECTEQGGGFGEVSAKVRWRRDSEYGVVFENTLTLEEFAILAAKLQDPGLLRANP